MTEQSRTYAWTRLAEYLFPRNLGSASIARQGLERLLLLRTFVTIVSTAGCCCFRRCPTWKSRFYLSMC